MQTADMLKLPVPEVEYHNEVIKPSKFQTDMVASFSERAEKVRNGMVDATVDNMLKITNDGRKLALDQRLTDAVLPDDPESKVNLCLDNIHRIWESSSEQKSTQLVFCDLSTPHGDGKFNVYNDLKAKLIRMVFPKQRLLLFMMQRPKHRKLPCSQMFVRVMSASCLALPQRWARVPMCKKDSLQSTTWTFLGDLLTSSSVRAESCVRAMRTSV